MNSKHFLASGASDEDIDAFVAAVGNDDEAPTSALAALADALDDQAPELAEQ